jgi:mannose-1-phosphate guanylyltransferase
MRAFVLAAGFGTRLEPLTLERPKPLVLVAGIPFICYSLALLKEAGVDSIVCNLHYRPGDIMDFFRRNGDFGFQVDFSMEENILGTGGGIKRCESLFSGGPFLLMNSDIIMDMDVKALISHHESSRHENTVVLCRAESGEATVSVEGDGVMDFRNSLGTGLAATHDYTGAAILSSSIFPFLETGFSSVVYTGFTGLISHLSLGYYEHRGLWMDAGTPESLALAEEYLSGEGAHLRERVLGALGPITP